MDSKTNWDLLCSLNLRNWSDRYSNWSFADAAAIDPQWLRWIAIGEVQLPPRTVTLFLHEVAHHLVFDSPVAWALASLDTDARSCAARFKNAAEVTPDAALRIFESMLRIQVASSFLKPLNEGIALFAEHEIYDLNSESDLSALLRCAWRAFFKPAEMKRGAGEHEAKLPLNIELANHRTCPEGFERKMSLLGRPFTAIQDGSVEGGLPAYVFLKVAFLKFARSDLFFAELGPDFFLSYLIWFFFMDRTFAALLVDSRSKSMSDAVTHTQVIGKYFRRRTVEFFDSMTHENVCRLQKEIRHPPHAGHPEDPFIREMMRIAAHPIEVRRDGDQIVIVHDQHELRLKNEEGLDFEDGPGTIELHVSPWQGYGCSTIYSRGRLLFADFVYEDRGVKRTPRFYDRNRDRDMEKAQDEMERDHLTMILQDLHGRRLVELNKLLFEEIDEVYMAMALWAMPLAARPRFLNLTREGGLFSILKSKPDLPQRYVELAAYSAIAPDGETLREQFARDNIDLNQVLAGLDYCRDISGFRFYVQGSLGGVLTFA